MGKRKIDTESCSIDITDTTPSPTGQPAVEVIDLAEDSPGTTLGKTLMSCISQTHLHCCLDTLEEVQVQLIRRPVKARLWTVPGTAPSHKTSVKESWHMLLW